MISPIKYINNRFNKSGLSVNDLLEVIYTLRVLHPTLTIPDIYDRLSLSRNTINAYCKTHYKCTVSEWLTRRASGPVYPLGHFVIKDYCILVATGIEKASKAAGFDVDRYCAVSTNGTWFFKPADGSPGKALYMLTLSSQDYVVCDITTGTLQTAIADYNKDNFRHIL